LKEIAMRIVYYGSFDKPWKTEVYVANTLEQMGHAVFRVPWEDAKVITHVLEFNPSVVLFSKSKSPDTLKIIQRLKNRKILTVCWQWDLYGIKERSDIPDEFNCDLVFGTDPGLPNRRQLPGHYEVLRQGIYQNEAIKYDCSSISRPVIFVGHPGHRFQSSRKELITWLQKTYWDDFTLITSVRGLDLNSLLSKTAIVVGDSYPSQGYWSNRIYEITGRGGFLLHPQTEGLEAEYTDGTHYVSYPRDDRFRLRELIDYYLLHDKERESIRLNGFNKTKQDFTYRKRCEVLLERIEEMNLLS
jgi:hypothetical protein